MNARDIALAGEILRSEVGSTLYGTGLPGLEDRDEMGVCLEPADYVVGLRQFEHWIHRTQPEGVRSGPGDLDLTIYSARKYLCLATAGNPSLLLLLFAPEDRLVTLTDAGRSLRDLGPSIVSAKALPRFLGYLTAQRERLEGIRKGRHTNRPELEEAHGYDTKYAMHAMRLGFQGVELATTGRMVLPIAEDPGDLLRAVRRGEVTLGEVLLELDVLQIHLKRFIDGDYRTVLRPEPDYDRINQWLHQVHLEYWQSTCNETPSEFKENPSDPLRPH